jgi:hypothetical protein
LQILRGVILLTSSDADKLVLYKEAKDILVGIQRSDYPQLEIDWLVSTAWNRGCHHANLRRVPEASGYMQAALDLVNYSQACESKRPAMMKRYHETASSAAPCP